MPKRGRARRERPRVRRPGRWSTLAQFEFDSIGVKPTTATPAPRAMFVTVTASPPIAFANTSNAPSDTTTLADASVVGNWEHFWGKTSGSVKTEKKGLFGWGNFLGFL